ncbi:hypothetical protein AB0C10_02650 [Microbispora amethystogenes]|uniref:hypothetical protein n=1 Tax=Microbispora amethystogenes TaxID=1427754 RepID=UPI0033EB7569
MAHSWSRLERANSRSAMQWRSASADRAPVAVAGRLTMPVRCGDITKTIVSYGVN